MAIARDAGGIKEERKIQGSSDRRARKVALSIPPSSGGCWKREAKRLNAVKISIASIKYAGYCRSVGDMRLLRFGVVFQEVHVSAVVEILCECSRSSRSRAPFVSWVGLESAPLHPHGPGHASDFELVAAVVLVGDGQPRDSRALRATLRLGNAVGARVSQLQDDTPLLPAGVASLARLAFGVEASVLVQRD